MAGYSSMTSQRQTSLQRGEGDGRANRMPWQRREAVAPRRAADDEPKALSEEKVIRSVRTVERAVERFSALQDDCDHFRELAGELRKAFDCEKEQARVFAQQLAEAERANRADRERAARAEDRLEQSAQTIRELERQLATVRAQTDRLVHTIARLMTAEKSRGGQGVDMAELLAA